MSTKLTIKWRGPSAGLPGFQLYEDVLDTFGSAADVEPPVYLRLDGVAVQLETRDNGGAIVTLVLPREVARELGLLAVKASASGA